MGEAVDIESLWDFQDLESSEAKFRDLLETSSNDDIRAEILTQIARTYGLRKRFDEAHETLDKAAGLMSSGSKAEVRYMLERGRAINSSGGQIASRQVFHQAVEAAKKFGDGHLIVDAMHMLGIVEDDDVALNWNLEAIAFAESSDDPKAQKWLASLYNNTAWSLFNEGRCEEALDLFEKAQKMRMDRGQIREEQIARWCVARCLRALGRNDEAFEMQKLLLAEVGDNDAYIHEELAILFDGRNEPSKGKSHAEKALAKLAEDSWFVENETARVDRLRKIAAG